MEKLARKIVTGLEKSGVNAKLFQVAETLPQDVLDKMHAPPKAEDVPFITSEQLREADGFVFGMPTRFGSMPSQVCSVHRAMPRETFSLKRRVIRCVYSFL